MSGQYELIGFVTASQYRQAAAVELADQPATPSGLAEKLGHDVAHISRGLSDLRDKGLVELLVSEDTRKGRIYGLTENGEDVVDGLSEVTA